MPCEPNEAVCKIAALRKVEATLIANGASKRALMAVHAETCAALTELLNDHGAKLGLDAPTISLSSEPKHK